MIKVIDENLNAEINYKKFEKRVAKINEGIVNRTSAGSDFLGWENVEKMNSKEEIEKIIKTAEIIRKNYEYLLVCGIGGSYLGARAIIEAINGLSNNNKLKIIFVGQTFSTDYVNDVLKTIKGKKFAINVISKSGSTTETSIAFRLFKETLEKQVGKEKAKEAIFVTTDPKNGILRKIADNNGYVTFSLPSNIGGRYSVLTPVGLLPIAAAGIDIKELLKGAKEAQKKYSNPNILENEAYKYAVLRYFEYKHGKNVEMLISYEPRLVQLGEWYKQLYAESEGKEHKALLPYYLTFSTDLHSIGQFIQEGKQVFFETILIAQESNSEIVLPKLKDNDDELNYLAGKTLNEVQLKAFQGVLDAHSKTAKVPNVVIKVKKFDTKTIGELIYFFEKAAAMSAYLLKVNPFNQPGVEVYKKNMFHLLGKKGY